MPVEHSLNELPLWLTLATLQTSMHAKLYEWMNPCRFLEPMAMDFLIWKMVLKAEDMAPKVFPLMLGGIGPTSSE